MANAAESGIISNHPRLGTELRLLLRLSATDPAAARNRIRRAIGTIRARWVFRNCQCGELVNVAGRVSVKAHGRIELGARVQFWDGVIPQELVCAAGAELTIGTLSMFDYGASIRAQRSIRVGKRCMFGSLVAIEDTAGERVAPIVIQDDVWVGHRAIVGPGVTIGEGSVVAAGSVVNSDVPPFSQVVGNPAKCRPLPPSERHS